MLIIIMKFSTCSLCQFVINSKNILHVGICVCLNDACSSNISLTDAFQVAYWVKFYCKACLESGSLGAISLVNS